MNTRHLIWPLFAAVGRPATFSNDFETYGTHDVCQNDVTASACAAVSGEFHDGGDCAAFDLLHVLTAN